MRKELCDGPGAECVCVCVLLVVQRSCNKWRALHTAANPTNRRVIHTQQRLETHRHTSRGAEEDTIILNEHMRAPPRRRPSAHAQLPQPAAGPRSGLRAQLRVQRVAKANVPEPRGRRGRLPLGAVPRRILHQLVHVGRRVAASEALDRKSVV